MKRKQIECRYPSAADGIKVLLNNHPLHEVIISIADLLLKKEELTGDRTAGDQAIEIETVGLNIRIHEETING